MTDRISIIIPVYNVKKYLKECVESALNQTYSSIEIILVDDGSDDGSEKICDELCRNTDRIRVFHRENCGLSAARNYGLDKCTGDYIYFLDSDDCIAADAIEILHRECRKYNGDIAVTEYIMFHDSENIPSDTDAKAGTVCFSRKEAVINMLLPRKYDHCSCGKLFRKKLWDNFRFPSGRLYEDLDTTYDIFLKADRVVYHTAPKYYYRIRHNSIMNSEISSRNLVLLDISDRVADMLLNEYPDMEEIIVCKHTMTYANFYKNILCCSKKSFSETQYRIKSLCRRNLKRILKSEHLGVNEKIKVLALCISKYVYFYLYYLSDRLKRRNM